MQETAAGLVESEAVVNARRRIGRLLETQGAHHPEYATALNQLALLLIMQGDAGAAEPLLRQALEIRRESLGEHHPDFATNLSSLGGLLWARGELDEAEPLIRRAVEVRSETLGPQHPKTIVSLSSLEQLLKARGERTEMPRTGSRVAEKNAPEPAAIAPLFERLARLRLDFETLGSWSARVGEALCAGAMPQSPDFEQAMAHTRATFEGLALDLESLGRRYSLSVPVSGFATLTEIEEFLPSLQAAESSWIASEEIRRQALGLLDRIDRLALTGAPAFAVLASCREQARDLRSMIERTGPGMVPEPARALASGNHPLIFLIRLIEADATLRDEEWAELYEQVAGAFGQGLAVAAARRRLSCCPS